MNDIVERLRAIMAPMHRELAIEAADEIERLKAALQQIAHDKTEIGYAQHIARAALAQREGK